MKLDVLKEQVEDTEDGEWDYEEEEEEYEEE